MVQQVEKLLALLNVGRVASDARQTCLKPNSVSDRTIYPRASFMRVLGW